MAQQRDNDYDWYFSGTPATDEEWKDSFSSPQPCWEDKHIFPDTGMRKSWCKKCGEEGEFSFKTGKYGAVRHLNTGGTSNE